MHELSIAVDIIKIVEDAAKGAGILRVDVIEIEIGELSGIEIEAMKTALDISKEGTVAANAELNIKIIKGEGHCLECGKDTPVRDLYSGCPSCGSFRLDITKGMEKRVVSIYTND